MAGFSNHRLTGEGLLDPTLDSLPEPRDHIAQLEVFISTVSHQSDSAAGGGGDGAVQEGERAGGSVDWEVEHCARLPPGRTAHLGRAGGGRQDLGLKLQQLAHKAEVGGDDAASLLDELKGLVQLHPPSPHEVR